MEKKLLQGQSGATQRKRKKGPGYARVFHITSDLMHSTTNTGKMYGCLRVRVCRKEEGSTRIINAYTLTKEASMSLARTRKKYRFFKDLFFLFSVKLGPWQQNYTDVQYSNFNSAGLKRLFFLP